MFYPYRWWSWTDTPIYSSVLPHPPSGPVAQTSKVFLCRANSGCCRNWAFKNVFMTLCAWRVPHKYWYTINKLSTETYSISDSTRTLPNSLHTTLIVVNTAVQHYALPDKDTASPYAVVTKLIWNASSTVDIWYQKTPHLLKISLAISIVSVCIWKSLLIPACNLIIWSWSDFDALG